MAAIYGDEIKHKNMLKIKELLSEMPDYVRAYFSSRRTNTTTKTRLAYAYDLKKFFAWLKLSNSELKTTPIKDISLDVLSRLTAQDINEYLDYLQTDADEINDDVTVARKISCLSSFFNYLVVNDGIAANPCDKIIKPRLKNDRRIIRLSPDEVVKLLDAIEFGCENMSQRQKNYLKNTRERDLAIATLMLGTGIRVSECVGLNRKDLDFENCKISILRKGDKHQFVAMGDEVIEALNKYLKIRNAVTPVDADDADALFLSTQKKRISVQAVENMITKYADFIGTREHITPHKLRKTYGTELYDETGDIYLVARALGHESVNTTKDHYIATNEDSLLRARNKVKLR